MDGEDDDAIPSTPVMATEPGRTGYTCNHLGKGVRVQVLWLALHPEEKVKKKKDETRGDDQSKCMRKSQLL